MLVGSLIIWKLHLTEYELIKVTFKVKASGNEKAAITIPIFANHPESTSISSDYPFVFFAKVQIIYHFCFVPTSNDYFPQVPDLF